MSRPLGDSRWSVARTKSRGTCSGPTAKLRVRRRDMASSPVHPFTEEEYLALEEAAEYKSEFVDGEIFAMAGGSSNHLRLQRNFQGELFIRLRGGPCEVVGSD